LHGQTAKDYSSIQAIGKSANAKEAMNVLLALWGGLPAMGGSWMAKFGGLSLVLLF
jgi:hypothetical protein